MEPGWTADRQNSNGGAGVPLTRDCETGMRLRALTLIVLMATWMVPPNGYSCPTDSTAVAAHGHEHGVPSHSHSDDAHSHASDERSHAHPSQDGGLPHHVEVAEAYSGRIPRAVSDDRSSCCESGRDVPAVEAAVKNAELRPKSADAVLQLIIATAAPAVPLATAAQLRRQQPPPVPYEKNRRPLLI